MDSHEEPMINQWVTTALSSLLESPSAYTDGNPITVIGIDGRSGSGKTSLAADLATNSANVAVIHTDDIAWHQSFFDWDGLLVSGILAPLRRSGPPISFRPPAWDQRDRPGSIDVPAESSVVIVEGVGACRKRIQHWYDVCVWVHSDAALAYRRVLARGADPPQFNADWDAAEAAFLSHDRPWTRADVIVSGQLRPPTEKRILARFAPFQTP